ncbi:heterokaryon incompatibility protein-domain-containing protein [Rhexocercosporidium sp. MPI-PUGE-AT-0058]|nr:heterokaryon incompatibility protein-domain-containing protein [Rhexocercosporidium sp. MPI-PUGE-AT-0058]
MLYSRLDFLSYEIRLLNIQEASDDKELCCTLEHTTLIEPGSYYALSYCWGDLRSKKKILINNTIVEVGHNLEAALQQLRSRGYIRIWIDALCINQNDDEERGLQIRNMRQIYSQALSVILWLGDDPDNTANAIKYLFENERYMWFPGRRYTAVGMTSNARLSATETEKEWDVQRWRLFQGFFELPYWRRAWVIQEIASSSQVTVLFGQQTLEWRHITKVLAYWKQQPGNVPMACLSYMYAAELDHFRIRYKDLRQISLLEAIQWSQYALATDQRDKIYALLGLTSDGPRLVPMPNYQRSFEQILCDLTQALLSVVKISDPRSEHIPVHSKRGWPWWEASSLELWIEVNTALGIPFWSLYPMFSHVQMQRALDEKSLQTHGILLGQVNQTSSRPPDPEPFAKRLKSYVDNQKYGKVSIVSRNPHLYPSGLPAAILHTLCLGRPASGIDSQSCLNYLWSRKGLSEISGGGSSVSQQGKQWIGINKWLRSNSALRIGSLTLEEWAKLDSKSSRFKDVLHAATAPFPYEGFGRNVDQIARTLEIPMALIVTDTGIIARAPPSTKIGDWVFYMKGASIPVILRQKEMPSNSPLQEFLVVGGAYIHMEEFLVVGGAYIHMDEKLPGGGGFGDWAETHFMKPEGLQSVVIS